MTGRRHSEGIVAALNADVVGYSRLLADDLDATSDAMVATRDVVERGVSGAGGTLVNFVGDNFMAVFDTAMAGVRAAIDISSQVEERNADVPSNRRLRFRMGMDLGAVSVSDGHYEGDALNIAARIQAIAPAGGLSVSGPVYRALDEPALRFRATGEQHLKNIPEPVEVYQFSDLPRDTVVEGHQSDLSLEIPTIAVLPIHTEGADEKVAAGAQMIRADILYRLASIPDLMVVDAGEVEDQADMGATARYMLESGVHQFGDSIRAYVTLFDVTTMNIVKSHRVSSTVDGLLDLSDELSEEVGQSIEIELVIGAPAGLYAELGDPETIQKVYLGWYHLRSDNAEGWRRAVSLFSEVADSRPDLPYGWVLLGFANWAGASNGWAEDSESTLAAALHQADKGMQVGDPTGMAHTVRAAVMMSKGQVTEAVNEMDSVEITRPTCDVTFGLEGSLRRYLGEWEEALDLVDVAMRLTGINKPWYPTIQSCSLFIGNRVEQAASVAEGVLEYQPNNIEALLVLTAAQVEMGLDRRARATAQQIRDRFPTLDAEEWLDRNPYQDDAVLDRWKSDLASVDLISSSTA